MSFKNDELTLAAALAILKWGLKILVLPLHTHGKKKEFLAALVLDLFFAQRGF